MANSHYERWVLKAPVAILFISGGVFFMYYSITQLELKGRWVVYGLISAAAVGIGSFMLASAFINKMKSDLIKKQKAKSLEKD